MQKLFGLRKQYLVKRPQHELEPQEVFLDGLAQKKEKEHGSKERKFEVPPSPKAIFGFLFFSLTVLALLFLKTFQLSIVKGNDFSTQALQNFSRITPLRADRGIIYDRDLKKLVANAPSFDLVVEKRDLPTAPEKLAEEIIDISQILKQDPDQIKQQIDGAKENTILISENLDHEAIIALEAESDNFPGFKLEKNIVRNYFNGDIFSQILGFMGRVNSQELQDFKDKNYFVSDYIGKQGLEKTYEDVLRGTPGIFEVQKDALAKKLKEGIIQEAQPGQSLILWLNSQLQSKLFEELSRVAGDIGITKGAAIALDPKTGGVLALVSLPSFDNNVFSGGANSQDLVKILENPNQPLFNRAISGLYASGSSIKPLVATAALEENIISPNKQIYSQGFITVKNQYNPDIIYTYHDTAPAGWVDMRKAIAISCNVYFYTIGGGYLDQKGLGSTRLKNYLNLFGWGEKTNIDLPQEAQGLVPDHIWKEENINEPWSTGDTYNLSIGQGYLQVTPLQLATAFTAIANKGRLMKPQVVKEIIEGQPADNKVVKEFLPEIIRNTGFSEENLKIVLQGMRDGVIYGSSTILADLPVSSAAKTGTAQTPKANRYYNWVTVIAPYDDPQIVLTVMLEDVPGVRAAALPVAHEVLKWYFTK